MLQIYISYSYYGKHRAKDFFCHDCWFKWGI